MVAPHVYDNLVREWGFDPMAPLVINEDEVKQLCTSELQEAANKPPRPYRKNRNSRRSGT